MSLTTGNTSNYNTYQQLGLAPSTSSASSATSGTSALGEGTFLKLMVTELQNQDPT